MYYIAVEASPRYHQMTLDELLYGLNKTPTVCMNLTNTKTYEVESFSEVFLHGFSVDKLIEMLEEFNERVEPLRHVPRRDLYYSFVIPKKSGGLRHIDAPQDELMKALRTLKNMFETAFHAKREDSSTKTTYYHTSAFAYIKQRSIIDSLRRHQSNESKWFAKLDFSNFFGTTTYEFTMSMLTKIFPFCEICRTQHGYDELAKAVELGFLDGVLPQGTPLSPTLTNIIMLPIDFKLFNKLHNYSYTDRNGTMHSQKYVYTRYADDILISSRCSFNIRNIESLVNQVLREFNAPYKLKKEKTRYGSIGGANWNLGLMLNKNNDITVGYKNIKRFKSMLFNYAMDKKRGIHWVPEDIATVLGLRSYYRMVEEETIDKIVLHMNKTVGMDIVESMKSELHTQH